MPGSYRAFCRFFCMGTARICGAREARPPPRDSLRSDVRWQWGIVSIVRVSQIRFELVRDLGTKLAHSKRHFFAYFEFDRRDIAGVHVERYGMDSRNVRGFMDRIAEALIELQLDEAFEHVQLERFFGAKRK